MKYFRTIPRILDRLYLGAGILAGVFLVMIAVLVLAQIIARLLGSTVPSADQFAGFCLSASSFLALAHTLRRNAHIRVSLLIERLAGRSRRAFELWCLFVASAMASYFAYYAVAMAWRSYELQERTIGLVPIPIWIPQSGMAIGVTLLAVAFFEDLLRVACGHAPAYEASAGEELDESVRGGGS